MTHEAPGPRRASRRRFLQQLSSAGLALGGAPWLVNCGGGGRDDPAAPWKETRTYYFSLPAAQAGTQLFLVAGTVHHRLVEATPAHLAALHLLIPALPDNALTHVAEQIPMSARSPQLCYVKGVYGRGVADWHMHTMLYHIPAQAAASGASSVARACKLAADLQRQAFASCPGGSAALQALVAGASFCSDPAYDAYKDYFDHAVALISSHHEIGSFDAATLAYVQQNIICADPAVFDLAVSLYQQGPATPTGGWATLVPFIDPDTGQVRVDAKGQQLCTVVHSQETLRLTGLAIQAVLQQVKDDPRLGLNITGLRPDQLNTALQGKLWTVRDGTPTAPGSATGGGLFAPRAPADASPTLTWRDVSSGPGYSIGNFGAVGRTVSFTVTNSYLRYLGLYARFLDANGVPIPLSSLPVADQFPHAELNGTFDGFIAMVNQELVVLAVAVQQDVQSFSITLPAAAASMQILAGGLGSGTRTYPSTTDPGAIMTVVLDLAIPGVFLTMAAVSGYASLSTQLSKSTQVIMSAAQVFIAALADEVLYQSYHDASEFKNLVAPLAGLLIQSVRGGKAKELGSLVTSALAEGEAEGVAEDAIPFGIGVLLQAALAATVGAQIGETSAETARSPWTYVTAAVLSHDLTVTINHDPLDVAGFPATATSYQVLAVCDGSSPRASGPIAMPAGTRTAPLTYTFRGLPSGGSVKISVTFQSANGTLVGAGSTGNISNVPDNASVTIKELLVPLTASTRYTHREKIALDASGRHVWVPTPTAPFAPALNCGNPEGNLCELVGITLSEPFGAIGYAWKASSAGVQSFTGATGQLYQFANISFTDSPEGGYLSSRIGFPAPARIAYDRVSPGSHSFYIDTTTGNLVRRINMIGVDRPPTFDGAGSNRCVGRFNFASDAFLIHPTGKLISFNSERSKMEVLTPSESPTPDADAVQAQSYSGPGSREGLLRGPVCAAVAHDGSILVIEAGNNRIQAFDTGANPAPVFGASSTMPLQARSGARYLDLTVESTGFIYVLLLDANGAFFLDIYKADGTFVASTPDVRASKIAVDLFRNTYTLNFENIRSGGSVEPSVSQWIPST